MRAHILSVILLLSIFVGCISEPEESDPIVCNSPYIRVGSGCCLDRDDNRICDVDETTTTRRTTTSAAVTSSSTTSTSSTTTSTTTTTTTTTSTTTTTRILPVSEKAFEAHVLASDEYRGLVRKYGESKVGMGGGPTTYSNVRRILDELLDDGSDDCINCYDFSRDSLWAAEFGAKNMPGSVAYMILIDMETGTGAMYRYRNGSSDECRCDTI